MKIPYFVVDAFTERPFGGNPAGVCPLEAWLPDSTLQSIAFENNLSETAFFVADRDRFHLRWFTPTAEVDLCGHATLASAHVLFERWGHKKPSVQFETKSGALTVSRERDGRLTLDFPSLPLAKGDWSAPLSDALGAAPAETWAGMDHVAVYPSAETVAGLTPNLELLKKLDRRGVLATAPGGDCDYVLRCFGPKMGIAEDPATGSAQSMLAPFWALRLGKTKLHVRQLSRRGGEFWCEHRGDRVLISGRSVIFSGGEIGL